MCLAEGKIHQFQIEDKKLGIFLEGILKNGCAPAPFPVTVCDSFYQPY